MDTSVNLALQKFGALAPLMHAFTFAGSEYFFLALLPLIYWCVSARAGARLGLLVLVGDVFNNALKLLFHGARPYWVDRRVTPLELEGSYGLPSGHAQNAFSAWFFLAANVRRRWFWILAVVIVFLVSLSRVFLGVHFALDVVGGWIFGALFLWLFSKFEPQLEARFEGLSLGRQISVAAALCAAILGASLLLRMALSGVHDPAAWTQYMEGERDINAVVNRVGALFGLLVGLSLARRTLQFSSDGAWWLRVLRFGVGIIGVLIFYVGVKAVLPHASYNAKLRSDFTRYALMTLWVTFGAPVMFVHLGLMRGQRRLASRV